MPGGAVIVFLLSLSFIVYVAVGYPLLLAVLARHDHKIDKHFEPKTVTLLLPVYNGEKWMRNKLRSILGLDYPRELLKIMVISDGSSDGTDDIVREFAGDGVELLRVPRGGKAAALNAGMRAAEGEILFFTDVRQPLDPGCLKSLVSCLGDPSVGAACGQVCFLGAKEEQRVHMGVYWRYEKWIRLNHTRIHSIQAGTGCIYAMRRVLTSQIPPETLLDDTYLPLCGFFRGYRFVFDPGAVAHEYPTGLHAEFHRNLPTHRLLSGAHRAGQSHVDPLRFAQAGAPAGTVCAAAAGGLELRAAGRVAGRGGHGAGGVLLVGGARPGDPQELACQESLFAGPYFRGADGRLAMCGCHLLRPGAEVVEGDGRGVALTPARTSLAAPRRESS